MIPKIIHYCWFGRKPLPKSAEKYMRSWRQCCPDYQIIEWNEDNYDLAKAPLYVRQAYEAEKWAFVTDYVRLQIVYENGGIYLDTDVEVIRNLDSLLDNEAFFGIEIDTVIATGLGFGAEKGNSVVKKMMDDYKGIPFIREDGTYDLSPCPGRNTRSIASLLANMEDPSVINHIEGATIYPKEYFCPLDYESLQMCKTEYTMTIHWFANSWSDPKFERKRRFNVKKDHLAKKVLGNHFDDAVDFVQKVKGKWKTD